MISSLDPNYYYTVNGFIIHDILEIPPGANVTVLPRLFGGKGGFGSMLRAIGSQIEKTTNKEMCRDLSGRRMRDVNYEKKLKDWLEKADDRERVKLENYLEKRRKRKELLECGPKCSVPFEDRTRDEQQKQIVKELEDAISEAFIKVASQPEPIKSKRLKMRIDDDYALSDNSSSSECDSKPTTEAACSTSYQEPSSSSSSSPASASNDQHVGVFEPNKDEEPCIKKIVSESTVNEYVQKFEEIVPLNDVKVVVNKPTLTTFPPINLDQVGSVTQLLTFGADWIKFDLQSRGLKCGGTLVERAERLFSVKGLKIYPDNLLVGRQTGKRKK